jgi:hypothetical protein
MLNGGDVIAHRGEPAATGGFPGHALLRQSRFTPQAGGPPDGSGPPERRCRHIARRHLLVTRHGRAHDTGRPRISTRVRGPPGSARPLVV